MAEKLLFLETSIDSFATKMVLDLKIACEECAIELVVLVLNKNQQLFWKKKGINSRYLKTSNGENGRYAFEKLQQIRTYPNRDFKQIHELPSEKNIINFLNDFNPNYVISFVGPEAFKHSIMKVAKSLKIFNKFIDYAPIPGRLALVEKCFSAQNLKHTFDKISEPHESTRLIINKLRSKQRIATVRSDNLDTSSIADSLEKNSAIYYSRLLNVSSLPKRRIFYSFISKIKKILNKFLLYFLNYKNISEINRESDQKKLLIAFQTSTETAFAYGSRFFDTPENLFIKLSKYFNFFLNVTFRLHPFAKTQLFTSTIFDLVLNRYKVCHESISPKEIILDSDYILVWNGNIGFESILNGKVVITLGDSYYSGLGLTCDIHSFECLSNIEKILENSSGPTENQIEKLVESILVTSFEGSLNKNGMISAINEIRRINTNEI